MAISLQRLKSSSLDLLSPPTFEDQFKIVLENPSLQIVHFDLIFKVKNRSKIPCILGIYVKSTTQAICFTLDSPIKVWKRKYGIIPYRKEEKISLDNYMEQIITPDQEVDYSFHGWYRPRFAFQDFQFRRKIIIFYHFYAYTEDKKGIWDFHERRIEIPFQKESCLQPKGNRIS